MISTNPKMKEEVNEDILSQVFLGIWVNEVPGKAKMLLQYKSNLRRGQPLPLHCGGEPIYFINVLNTRANLVYHFRYEGCLLLPLSP